MNFMTFKTMLVCFFLSFTSYSQRALGALHFYTASLCKYCTNIKFQGYFWDISHLSWCTLCAIHWRSFFGFTKVLVIRMAAPQLLARVIGSKLNGAKKPTVVSTAVFMLQKETSPLTQWNYQWAPVRYLHLESDTFFVYLPLYTTWMALTWSTRKAIEA